MVDVASNLSVRQLLELEGQISKEQSKTQNALSLENRPRHKPELKKESWLERRRQDPTTRFMRSSDEFLDDVYDKMPWTHRPHISAAHEICVHEATLPTETLDINQIQVLKHLALYSEHTVIRDPLERWGPDPYGQAQGTDWLTEQRRHLANGLRQLLPIAPLVRSGAFILAAKGDTNAVFSTGPEKADPFLSWILGHHRPDLRQEIEQLHAERSSTAPGANMHSHLDTYHRLRALDVEAQAVVRRHYPYDLSDQAWEELMAMVRWTSQYSLTPVTTNPVVVRHLLQGARIALEGQSDATSAPGYPPPQGAAVSYQVPALDSCSLPNIIRLRGSSLFDELRSALLLVASKCAENNPQSYAEYQHTVAKCADDIVGPLYRKLETRRRRNRWASLGILAASEAVDMQVNGIAGKLTGAAVNRLGGHIPRRRQEQAETACGILKSILLYK